jgi:hypothetical protein
MVPDRAEKTAECMENWEKKMEEEWGRPFVHESGHALIAVLEGIPCHGICFEKGEGAGRFCALIAPTPPGERSKSNYMVSSAGSAAEHLIYGSYDQGAAATDRKDFDGTDAPSPDTAAAEASAILASKRRQLKRLVSLLKSKARAVDFDLTRLPNRTMDGSNKRYSMLLSKEEIESAVHRS